MAKKYGVKKGYEACVVVASKPLDGRKDGSFDLSTCTQRELKYLHDVVNYEGVVLISDEKE